MVIGLLASTPSFAVPCSVTSIADTDARLLGEGPPANIGRAIAAGPQLAGSSRTPLLVGAPSDEDGDTNAGATHVVGGVFPASLDISEISVKVTGDQAGQLSGSTVAADDRLWIGAPGDLGGRGGLFVLDWPADEPTLKLATRIVGEDTASGLGKALTAGPSPLGFGTAIVAGAPEAGTGGRAYVFEGGGPTPASLADAALIVSDVTPGEQLGTALALGDFDGDGLGDLALGAPAVGPGRVYVFYGPLPPGDLDVRVADVTIEGDQAGDRTGTAVVGLPGFDGSPGGLAVGAPLAQNPRGEAMGRACWFPGGRMEGIVRLEDAPTCIWGDEPGGAVGESLASGDVNADGFADLWVGAPELGGGIAYLLLGPAIGSLLVSQGDGRVEGTRAGDAVGAALAVVGDRDLDSYPDTLVGAPGFGSSGTVALVRGGFCPPVRDVDRDGASADEDCDDLDATRSPNRIEDPCNGIDDDCDSIIDEIDAPRFADLDGDGFGDASSPADCEPDSVADASDCDDARADVFPGAPEVCGDGVDADCDGNDDCPAIRGCLGSGGTFGVALLPLTLLLGRRAPRP